MLISYDEASAIAQKELKAKKNLSLYCKHIGIPYLYALQIKNGNSAKKYPKVLIKILENLGYSVTKIVYFKLDKNGSTDSKS